MENKKVELKEIDWKQAEENERLRGGLPPKMQWAFDQPADPFLFRMTYSPPNFQHIPTHPIITEDIDCEIVESKQLPPSK